MANSSCPFGAHVVIGDDSAAATSRAYRVGVLHTGTIEAVVSIEVVGHRDHLVKARGGLGYLQVEDQFSVDTVVAEFLFKAIGVHDDWTVAHRKEITNPQSVGKDGDSGQQHFRGTGGVVEGNAARQQMLAEHFQELNRQQVGSVFTPVESGVHQDGVILGIRIGK